MGGPVTNSLEYVLCITATGCCTASFPPACLHVVPDTPYPLRCSRIVFSPQSGSQSLRGLPHVALPATGAVRIPACSHRERNVLGSLTRQVGIFGRRERRKDSYM